MRRLLGAFHCHIKLLTVEIKGCCCILLLGTRACVCGLMSNTEACHYK